jgi:hypothetical protein
MSYDVSTSFFQASRRAAETWQRAHTTPPQRARPLPLPLPNANRNQATDDRHPASSPTTASTTKTQQAAAGRRNVRAGAAAPRFGRALTANSPIQLWTTTSQASRSASPHSKPRPRPLCSKRSAWKLPRTSSRSAGNKRRAASARLVPLTNLTILPWPTTSRSAAGAAAANSVLPKQSIGMAKSTATASSAVGIPSTQSVAFTVPSAARPTRHRTWRILNSINSAKRNARRS